MPAANDSCPSSAGTYLSKESGVFLSGGGRNLVFFEEVGGSLSAGGGGGGSKPEGGGGRERGPACEESERKTGDTAAPSQPWEALFYFKGSNLHSFLEWDMYYIYIFISSSSDQQWWKHAGRHFNFHLISSIIWLFHPSLIKQRSNIVAQFELS